jgi:RNA polymerase sigma-70 factor, ECF subfamily
MRANSDLGVLMARYQAGDFAAASLLVHLLSAQLHRFFVAQFASRSDADDLLQETWLRIHKVRHTFRQSEPLLPWIYAIARHVRADHCRKALRETARERKFNEWSEAAAVSSNNFREDTNLETLLAPLPDSQREVILMLKLSGMSLEEVARATSSSVGSVKQKVHRAYKKLREGMSPMGQEKGQSGGPP